MKLLIRGLPFGGFKREPGHFIERDAKQNEMVIRPVFGCERSGARLNQLTQLEQAVNEVRLRR